MMTGKRLTGFILALLVLMSTSLRAENKPDQTNSTTTDTDKQEQVATTATKVKFTYRPPKRGAPAVRIGGGTRGIGKQILELVVFAPDHTGLTTKEQPTLYWYTSEPVLSKLELTMINDKRVEPQLERTIESSGSAGIHSIDLSETQIKLEPGVEYRWFVSVIADQKQRSNDVVASGTIQRIIPDTELTTAISVADESSLFEIYAQQGIWYDAIDSLSEMSSKRPDNASLIEQRATLLEQVGLESVATYLRNHQ